jgi:hypothetical protein
MKCSPTTRAQVATTAVATAQRMENYWRWALKNQVMRVNIPPALRAIRPLADGQMPNVAFVQYLQWRRSLNPARFDRNHPCMGPMLARDQVIRRTVVPAVTPPKPICPTPTKPKPTVRPSVVRPPQVPEPPSAAVLGLLFGAAMYARHWRRRHQTTA